VTSRFPVESDLAVDRRHPGSGIGSALVDRAERRVRELAMECDFTVRHESPT
jgi:hypothetical protein